MTQEKDKKKEEDVVAVSEYPNQTTLQYKGSKDYDQDYRLKVDGKWDEGMWD